MGDTGMSEKKRLHFGVMFSTMDNTCLIEIWNGITEYAKTYDIHLTAYMGTYQTNDNDFASHLETCFETIKNSKSLDGVILFAGFIAQHLEQADQIDLDSFDEYVARIPTHIPVVSVSFSMPGVPSVLADNIGGIYGAVEHLIKVHGKKEIAFVKGPDGHPEAEERLEGYKKALAANGIAFDGRYVLPGQFSQESGGEAVAEMLDNRRLSVDAIAASDDETAIGVLNELKRRNIAVPSDIAVTGFDDDKQSATFIPSISTARQDFYQIGMVSAENLRKKINGEFVQALTYVPSVFVARQSCGCIKKDFTDKEPEQAEVPAGLESLFNFAQLRLTPLFKHDVPLPLVEEWVQALVSRIIEKPFKKDEFLHFFEDILDAYSKYSSEMFMWHEALNILITGVELHHDEFESTRPILMAFNFAAALVNDVYLKEEKIREFAENDARLLLRRVTSALVLIFEVDALADELFKLLPELFFNTALIGLYRSPIKSSDRNMDRTIDTLIGFDGEQKFNIKHNSRNPILFSDYTTFYNFDFDRERRTLFFIPLFFKDEEVGIMLLPYDAKIPADTYETLRINISTAVKGAELLSKIQTLSITDELTGLLNRRGFFQFVYSRLRDLSRDTELLPAVMFMDMDGLKLINDTHGHKEGDAAISIFAKILKEALREVDIIGRIGGDEFVVFSSVKSKENSEQLVMRIRERLDEYNNEKLHPYNVSGSIGSVVLETATMECFEEAMLNADNVLYKEKMEKKKKGLSRR